jgi:signal transduction histidine kinase
VRDALDGVRELANEIYPPLLLDRGLAEALRASASRTGIPTLVEVATLQRYAPAVEATVYFCCLEALRSAAATAGAGARATVRAWEEQGALRFEVLNEGLVSGEDADGLDATAERVEALGGRLTVSLESGRKRRLVGTIPLSP